MSNITAKDIKTQLFNKFTRKNLHVVDNIFLGKFESDFLYVTKSRFINEVEIKISKSDFENDFNKGFYRHKEHGYEYARSRIKRPDKLKKLEFIKKHDLIKRGEFGIKGFYFAMSEELASKVEIPDYCGLIIVPEQEPPYEYFYRSILIEKHAPTLPNALKITPQRESQIAEAIKWRYLNDRMRGR
jgi:hypothetical protein